MRRGWIELGIVLIAAALLGWTLRPSAAPLPPARPAASPVPPLKQVFCLSTPASTPMPATPNANMWPRGAIDHVTVYLVAPGDDRSSVHRLLGAPPRAGPLEVENGQHGSWEEYATAGGGCTWEGRPTISYRADETVLAVCGQKFEVAITQLHVQTVWPGTTAEEVANWLGPPHHTSATSAVYIYDDARLRKQLTITFANRKLTRVVLSSERR